MANIRKIEPIIPRLTERKRVAAYARVSMETELLHHSLSAQVSHYSSLIQSNPEWEYAGVYADEGITGTSTRKRDAFNRLMKDCDDGKIDLVLVKSISRFARDTVDTLNATRHLKKLGIDVFFEREGIHQRTGTGFEEKGCVWKAGETNGENYAAQDSFHRDLCWRSAFAKIFFSGDP